MKKILIPLIVFILILVLIFFYKLFSNSSLEKKNLKSTIKLHMKISSKAFENNQQIPDKYTCRGDNINPPLEFSDIPDNSKSLVLIMDDPDAPSGTWVHWVIFNMSTAVNKIEENSKPLSGVEAMTSFGKPGYGGPCPPSGTHRYIFKLYALNGMLNLDEHADKRAVESAMQPYIIDQSQLTGLYSKK